MIRSWKLTAVHLEPVQIRHRKKGVLLDGRDVVSGQVEVGNAVEPGESVLIDRFYPVVRQA